MLERKVSLCAKLFDFFLGEYSSVWPEICHVLPKFSRDSYVEFQEKTILGEFFRNFIENQGYSLPKLVKFRHTFCNFILGSYCVEKILTSTFISCLLPGKEAHPSTNHKKKIQGRKPRTFCFRKTSFVQSRSGTYYALLLGYFGMKFLPDIRHCVYWVLAKIRAPNTSHRICNKFFNHHCQGRKEGSFVCQTIWFFS